MEQYDDIKWNEGGRLGAIVGYVIVGLCVLWIGGILALCIWLGKAMDVPAPF